MSPTKLNKKQFSVTIIAISILAAGIGTGVTFITLQPNPISPGTGTLTGSADLTLESQELKYVGTNVTAVDVTINNSDTTDSHTVDIHIALRNTTAGTVVASVNETSKTINPDGTTTITVDIPSNVPVNEFDQLQVNVERTN